MAQFFNINIGIAVTTETIEIKGMENAYLYKSYMQLFNIDQSLSRKRFVCEARNNGDEIKSAALSFIVRGTCQL